MSRFPIDITSSKEAERLIKKDTILLKILENFFPFIIILFPLFISILQLSSDLTKSKPIGLSLFFFVSIIVLSSLLIYSIINLNSLKRINGVSRGKNSSIIKKIAKKNNWNVSSTNQHLTIIDFSWQDSGTDWGKQMTILYDQNDILVNCISFGIGSSPSPFHWFANKRKVNKLKAEFENEIKNSVQQELI